MNILDLSESRIKAIAEKLDMDSIQLENKIRSDISKSNIDVENINIKDDEDFRLSNDLAIFIY